MKYRNLGRSGISVSQICLGSMTWGSQNSEAEGHAQMDYAFEHGVNFIDTAEMYPATPTAAKTQGHTEEIVGTWLKKSGQRERAIIATKVTGAGLKWIQNGIPISGKKIKISIEGSLKRLQTDYIDLYQLHWPNRGSYAFRQNWKYDPTSQNREQTRAEIQEILETLQTLVDEGKVRQIGLSNESCWGCCQFLEIASSHNLPRIVSVQNEYHLLYRPFDLDMSEMSHNEDVGLLSYSPLATGMLTGKYANGVIPEGSRRAMNADLFRRYNEHTEPVMNAYNALAAKHGLSPEHLALAFCLSRPFMTSVIIGATNLQQLESNIAAADITLSDEILDDIYEIYRRYPMPM